MQLQPFFCTKPHPVAYCSVPCPLAMAEPALLWTAADMKEREDGRYEYIPTQVFDNPVALSSVHWRSPPLARQRLLMISATHHTNTTIGNIYVATLSDRSRTAVARAPHHRAHRALMAGWAGGASTCILDVMIADGPGRDGSTLHGSVGRRPQRRPPQPTRRRTFGIDEALLGMRPGCSGSTLHGSVCSSRSVCGWTQLLDKYRMLLTAVRAPYTDADGFARPASLSMRGYYGNWKSRGPHSSILILTA